MATLEELIVRIRADASQLEREMNRASSVTQRAGGKMGAALDTVKGQFLALVPAVSLAALVTFGKSAIDAAGRLQDLGDRIGFAASTLSALEPGLAASGSSVDDLAASVNLMNNQLGEAAKGSQEAIKAFDGLGLSVTKLKELSPEEQFYAVVEALGQLDNQYQQTEAGRAIFGRGFAALIPLIKESNGNLKEHVATQKDLSGALSDETIKRIDDFGDALSNAGIKAKNSFLEAFSAILQVTGAISDGLSQFGQGASQGGFALAKNGILPEAAAEQTYIAKARRLGFSTGAAFAGSEQYGPNPFQGPLQPKGGARGSNIDILKPEKTEKQKQAEKALNDELREREAIVERNRTAYEVLMEDSAKANKLFADDTEQRNRELQRAWEDYATSARLGSDDAAEGIDKVKDSVEDLTVSIRDSLANSFEDAIFDAESFGDSIASILDEIARATFIDPLSGGISDAIKKSGALSDIGGFIGGLFGGARASGGPVASGMSYLVGEKGPEIFTPSISGAITPNHRMGGVTIVQNNSFGSGVTRSEVANMLPNLVVAAKNAVIEARQRGGAESRLLGGRD